MPVKMSSVPIPKVILGKHKQRSVMTEIFTDDGQIVDKEMNVLRGCCDDPNGNFAALIDTDNQFQGEDGQWYQLVGDRSCVPLCLRKPTHFGDLNKLIEEIARAAYSNEKRQQFLNALKNSFMEHLYWFIGIPCSMIVLIYFISKWKD